jgi:hypothetical protein
MKKQKIIDRYKEQTQYVGWIARQHSNKALIKEINQIKRLCPYVIDWHDETMIIQVTHFYKLGIIYKPLSIPAKYDKPTKTGRIRYERLSNHKPRLATIHDLNLHMGRGTRYMSAYFSDVKTFQRNHSQEL